MLQRLLPRQQPQNLDPGTQVGPLPFLLGPLPFLGLALAFQMAGVAVGDTHPEIIITEIIIKDPSGETRCMGEYYSKSVDFFVTGKINTAIRTFLAVFSPHKDFKKF